MSKAATAAAILAAVLAVALVIGLTGDNPVPPPETAPTTRSEEHTSELQSH